MSDWVGRAIETEKFHKRKLRENKHWTIQDSAKELSRSFGSVAEDLKLASWLETHPNISHIKTAKHALKYIRHKSYLLRTRIS